MFAPPNGFADLSAGQPVRFRARVSAPARRDLTVAVLNATGRPAGAMMWAGLSNCYCWVDRAGGLAGVFITQILPFADPASVGGYLAFEGAAYACLAKARAA